MNGGWSRSHLRPVCYALGVAAVLLTIALITTWPNLAAALIGAILVIVVISAFVIWLALSQRSGA